MSDLHPDLQAGLETLGIADEVPRLREAASRSKDTLGRAQDALLAKVPWHKSDDGLDVLVFGSYAREEATGESDFDYLVVVHRLPEEDKIRSTRHLLDAVQSFVADTLRDLETGRTAEPGRTGIFGTIASAPDLTERIGLEQDTNASHTRRLLLLQESASIYRSELRERLIRSILTRYQLANRNRNRPPRFLINDLLRYWYTQAVDYQAKRWERNERDWGLRYLKLIGSRKLTFASGLASLLLLDDAYPASIDNLMSEFDKPALARLAQLANRPGFEESESLREVFRFVESFLEFLADHERREEAAAVESLEDTEEYPSFHDMRLRGRRMDQHLKSVFFGSLLGERAKRYLVF